MFLLSSTNVLPLIEHGMFVIDVLPLLLDLLLPPELLITHPVNHGRPVSPHWRGGRGRGLKLLLVQPPSISAQIIGRTVVRGTHSLFVRVILKTAGENEIKV